MPKSPRIAVALKPDHEAAQYALGTALMRTERTEEGLSVLAEFERLQIAVCARTDAAWQITLLTEQAREHAARQEYAAAVDVLRRAMAYAPAEGSIRLAAGTFLVRAGKYEEAIPLLKEALAREATEAHRYLADAYDALGRNEESRAQREAYKAVAATRARQGVPIP
jgi:predicted Zn-dependent protease